MSFLLMSDEVDVCCPSVRLAGAMSPTGMYIMMYHNTLLGPAANAAAQGLRRTASLCSKAHGLFVVIQIVSLALPEFVGMWP